MTLGSMCQLKAGLEDLPRAMAFVETAGRHHAMAVDAVRKLQLAAEEVITALDPGTDLEFAVAAGADRTRLTITCHGRGMDLAAFNLAWRPDPETMDTGLGLALASRYVDAFALEADAGGRLVLQFGVDTPYDGSVTPPPPAAPWRFYRLIRPTPQTIMAAGKHLYHRALAAKGNPRAMHPDRLAALTAGDALFGTLAEADDGRIVGCCFCIPRDRRLLDGFGPFVFTEQERRRMARDLACHTLERVARKPYSGVLTTRYDGDCFPAEFFIPARRPTAGPTGGGGAATGTTVWHFPLADDAGGPLHYHVAAEPFIREAATLQDLPRQMIRLSDADLAAVTGDGASVFSTALDRGERAAMLHLLMPGTDLAANADAHLAFFAQEEIALCRFFLDLGRPGDAALIPVLVERGFAPCLLLPGGGRGDLLVLERLSDASACGVAQGGA
ncbi:ATP-binding protein [Desulfatitalea alkaliphila]|uniref:ATP-binding protein n=1 Tax=Desulfatitalea alkaliphila TaxID=2929485 RepID=A0AA41R4J9_9BACT|nr:ATP-binding protein [Desulfatitalea alkaliphila]MCJ8499178.1 ATP-binding protein [Desulfatitalea alkaliphila]